MAGPPPHRAPFLSPSPPRRCPGVLLDSDLQSLLAEGVVLKLQVGSEAPHTGALLSCPFPLSHKTGDSGEVREGIATGMQTRQGATQSPGTFGFLRSSPNTGSIVHQQPLWGLEACGPPDLHLCLVLCLVCRQPCLM